jgi:hyperosmotically inducible protein
MITKRIALSARRLALAAVVFATAASAGCAARQEVALRDDAAITRDVQERLAADPGVDQAAITVATSAGVVHISGNVGTDSERNAAERIARDTPGVRSVDNHVRFGMQ